MGIKLFHEREEIHLYRLKPRSELDDVQASFAALHLADHALIFAQSLAHVDLPESSTLTVNPQEIQENLVLRRVDGLVHGCIAAYPRTSDMPK